jgi:hypothetical protein
VVTRSIVVAATVARATLLPGSHIARRRRALPRLHIAVIVTLVGTSLNTARRLAVWPRATTRQFLHELLNDISVNQTRGREEKLTSISLSTASPPPIALRLSKPP